MNSLERLECYCQCCGETNKSKFYMSGSPLHPSGYLPVCKVCLKKQYLSYLSLYRSPRKALQRICMTYDIYYKDSIFDACDPDDPKFIGKYLARSNCKQNRDKGKGFDATIEEGLQFSTKFSINDNEKGEEIIDPKLIDSWGAGFDKSDYETLDSHYKYLKAANPRTDNSNQEIFIRDLCMTKMQQLKAAREGRVDDFNKLTDSYRKTFAQAGLRTVADTNEVEDFKVGVTIETIEKYTPAEYYKNKQRYFDFDKIGEYIQRFMLRPLRNLQFGTSDRDFEYYVKSEDDTSSDGDDDG